MKKNFSFSKFRIKDKSTHNFIDIFGGNQNHNSQENNSNISNKTNKKQNKKRSHSCFENMKKRTFPLIKNNNIIINNTKTLKLKQTNQFSLITDINDYKLKPILNKNFIIIDKNNINQKQKSKNKLPIPSNPKNQKIINKNYVININNNINNNYQVNLSSDKQNNCDNNEIIKNIKEEFSKMKIPTIDSSNSKYTTINKDSSQKLSELSDLSCFNPSKKPNVSNSNNNSLRGEVIDIFSISQESEDIKNIDSSSNANKEKNSLNEKENKEKKNSRGVYINPGDFKLFCKEVDKILNL